MSTLGRFADDFEHTFTLEEWRRRNTAMTAHPAGTGSSAQLLGSPAESPADTTAELGASSSTNTTTVTAGTDPDRDSQ